MSWIWTHDVKSQQYIYFTLPYRIIALFGACAYSRKTMFWELIENVGAPILYILRLTSVRLFSSRGACSLIGTYAKKCDNTVTAKNKSKNLAWNVLMYSKSCFCPFLKTPFDKRFVLVEKKSPPHFFLSAWLRGKLAKLCFIHCLIKWSCDHQTNRLHKLQCAKAQIWHVVWILFIMATYMVYTSKDPPAEQRGQPL